MRPPFPVPAILCLLLVACQKGGDKEPGPPPVSPAYKADVERVCDVMRLSGADQLSEGERTYATAQWLGDNLATQEGRDFLVTFQQSPDKAATLRAEAARVGLAGCPLADLWK